MSDDGMGRLKLMAQKAKEESRKKAETRTMGQPIRLRRVRKIDERKAGQQSKNPDPV